MHPILFHLGSFTVRSYGVLIVLGFSVGLWRAVKLLNKRSSQLPEGSPRRVSPDAMFDIGFYGLLLGMVGARLAFVLLDWSDYAHNLLSALEVWQGGLTVQGGMAAGIIFMVWYCRRRKVNLACAADVAGVSFPLAYAIGRIGCLLNGCCYGAPTNLPWGIRFPSEEDPGTLTPPSHPIQLYATILNLIFFAILVKWEKKKRPDGELFWAYIAMYGAYRFAMEFLRIGATSSYDIPSLHLTYTQVFSALMVLAGVLGVKHVRKRCVWYNDNEVPTSPHATSGTIQASLPA